MRRAGPCLRDCPMRRPTRLPRDPHNRAYRVESSIDSIHRNLAALARKRRPQIIPQLLNSRTCWSAADRAANAEFRDANRPFCRVRIRFQIRARDSSIRLRPLCGS